MAKYFQSRELSFETIFRETTQTELENLPDIGPEVASSVVEFFASQQDEILDLLSEIEILSPEVQEKKSGKWQ